MSDDHATPHPQDPAFTRRSRAEPPILDVDPAATGATTRRPALFAALVAGVIGGAIAGAMAAALTTGLIASFKKYPPDDQSQRVAAIEKRLADTITSERLLDVEKTYAATAEKNAARDQLIADLSQTVDQLTQSIGLLQKQSADRSDSELKNAIATLDDRLVALSRIVDALHSDPMKNRFDEKIRITSGLVLALRLRDQLQRGSAYDSTLNRLSSLAIDGLALDDLRAALAARPAPQEVKSTASPKINSDASLYDRLISGLSSFVTITPVEPPQKIKPEDVTRPALYQMDLVIDQLVERLDQGHVTP